MSKSRNHVGDRTILARASESQMSHFLKNNGLTIVLLLLFAASIIGQWITGWYFENEELTVHGEQAVSLGQYATDPHFISTVFENWESEFLQMSAYVVLRSEEHTSELQSLMRISYAVFCLKKKTQKHNN